MTAPARIIPMTTRANGKRTIGGKTIGKSIAAVTIAMAACMSSWLALVEQMLPSLHKAAGKENVIAADWVTGAEDFSYFGEKSPSFYFMIGGMPAGKTAKEAAPHHTPDFFIDDSRLDDEAGARDREPDERAVRTEVGVHKSACEAFLKRGF